MMLVGEARDWQFATLNASAEGPWQAKDPQERLDSMQLYGAERILDFMPPWEAILHRSDRFSLCAQGSFD